jgi:hypothetical protein
MERMAGRNNAIMQRRKPKRIGPDATSIAMQEAPSGATALGMLDEAS